MKKAFLFEDKISNTSSDCPAFRRLTKKLNPGDILFVTSLNQLGKNCDEVKEHWKIITKDCNCDLVVLDTPVMDTRTGETIKDVVIETFDAFSRIKRNYARQRQAEGIAVQLRQKQMWNEQYAEAKRFFEENGHLNVPAGYRSSSSKDLDAWIDRQRSAKVKAKLSDSQKKQLEAIGFQWLFDDPLTTAQSKKWRYWSRECFSSTHGDKTTHKKRVD